jgi:hypothetical protein
MKSHEFAGVSFAVTLFLLTAACSAHNSAKMETVQNASAPKVTDEKAAKSFDCSNVNEYRFVQVESTNRKADWDPLTPKDLNIVVGEKVIAKIELPRVDAEAKNFSLNYAKQTKAGFEIKVDWGGSLDHYEIRFNFKCKEKSFYLYEVQKISFSTTKPDSGTFWDKEKTKVTKIEPNLPIEKFVMIDYL